MISPNTTPIIAIDPGSHSGLSAWAHGRLVHIAAVEIPARLPRTVMVPELQRALDAMGNPDPAEVRIVIEGWLNPRGIVALKSLHRCKESWLDAAAELGVVHTSEVESNDWQIPMGCTGESAHRKRVSRCIASGQMQFDGFPLPPSILDLDENIADAVCLGLWWHDEHRAGVVPRVLATDGKKAKREAPRSAGRFSEADLKVFQARGVV